MSGILKLNCIQSICAVAQARVINMFGSQVDISTSPNITEYLQILSITIIIIIEVIFLPLCAIPAAMKMKLNVSYSNGRHFGRNDDLVRGPNPS